MSFKISFRFRRLFIEITSYLFVILFLYAAVSKLLDFNTFQSQLGQSPILSGYASWLVWVVPLVEILIAVALTVPLWRRWGAYAFLVMMIMFTIYIITILNFTTFVPCSCGGVLEVMNWTQHLIFNIIIISIAMTTIYLLENARKLKLKKLLVYFLVIVLFSIGMVCFLLLNVEKQTKRNNAFTRVYPPHPVKKVQEIGIPYNSYYMAGINDEGIWLGNTTAPFHVLKVGSNNDTTSIQLKVKGNPPLFKSVNIQIRDSLFFIKDGSLPAIYAGVTKEPYKAALLAPKIPFFIKAEPLTKNHWVILTESLKTREYELGNFNLQDSLQVKIELGLLTKQVDGLFDKDGFLTYNEELEKVIYAYRYRNELLVSTPKLDRTNFFQSIDTLSQVILNTPKNLKEQKLYSLPTIVHQGLTSKGKYLFIHSNRLGRYEPEAMLKEAFVIDVYNLEEETYLFSFYLHKYDNNSLNSLTIYKNHLYVLMDKKLYKYQLKKEHFKSL